jgi:hypothetical protein
MTANGYQPENWQWLDILTEPNPKRTDSTGRPKRMGRDPMTIPIEVLAASGHGPREARRVIGALGDEPIDPTIRSLAEALSVLCRERSRGQTLRRHRLSLVALPHGPQPA